LSKYRKLVPTLALICALVDGEEAVSQKSLVRALAWQEYLRSHTTRIYAAGTQPDTYAAKALLAKIRSGAVQDGFKLRDVYLKGWAHLNQDEASAAVQLLCDLGYLAAQGLPTGPLGGRPTALYRINPKL